MTTRPLNFVSSVSSAGATQSKSVSTATSVEAECICNRPKGALLCALCGYTMEGRIKKVCPQHKNRIFLTDMTLCPLCRCAYLDESKK